MYAAQMAPISPWRRRAGKLALWIWAPVLFVAVGSLMASHLYELPKPATTDPVTERGLNALRQPDERERWLAVHVLYAGCRCSERILKHLLESQRPAGVAEKILLVGNASAYVNEARARGFDTELVGKQELEERFHVVGVPALAIVAPEGAIRYLGGYTELKQGPVIRDVELIETTRDGGATKTLPLLGCAVSKELQTLLDPLGLKYGRGE
jgi:hypothetical protein